MKDLINSMVGFWHKKEVFDALKDHIKRPIVVCVLQDDKPQLRLHNINEIPEEFEQFMILPIPFVEVKAKEVDAENAKAEVKEEENGSDDKKS